MKLNINKRKVVEATAYSMLATVGFVMAIVGTIKGFFKKTVAGLAIGTIASAVTTDVYMDVVNSIDVVLDE